jgi:hypothetical protein
MWRGDFESSERHSLEFLEAAHRKAKGSPLYANYLAEDLKSGAVKIGDVASLPDGLEGYHNRQLERIGVLRMLNPVSESVQTVALAEFRVSIEMRHERMRSPEDEVPAGAAAMFNPVDEQLARASVLALLATDSNAATEEEISERLRFTVLRGQTPEECLMTVERALAAVAPLLKSAPIDYTGKEGFAIATPSIRRHLNSLAGVQQMEHRFARRPQAPGGATSDDSERREPFLSSERHWRERAGEDMNNTPEIEERVAACVKRMDGLERCLEASELRSAQNNKDPEGWWPPLFEGTVDEAVAELQANRDLLLSPSLAFRALTMVGPHEGFDWSWLLNHATHELRSANWIEPSLLENFQGSRYDGYRYYNWQIDDWHERRDRNGRGAKPLVGALDRHLNDWVRGRTAVFGAGKVRVSGVTTPDELQAVCMIVAEIFELGRVGAELRTLDACPVAVRIMVTRKDENSRARVRKVHFIFRNFPAIVELR